MPDRRGPGRISWIIAGMTVLLYALLDRFGPAVTHDSLFNKAASSEAVPDVPLISVEQTDTFIQGYMWKVYPVSMPNLGA